MYKSLCESKRIAHQISCREPQRGPLPRQTCSAHLWNCEASLLVDSIWLNVECCPLNLWPLRSHRSYNFWCSLVVAWLGWWPFGFCTNPRLPFKVKVLQEWLITKLLLVTLQVDHSCFWIYPSSRCVCNISSRLNLVPCWGFGLRFCKTLTKKKCIATSYSSFTCSTASVSKSITMGFVNGIPVKTQIFPYSSWNLQILL